MNEQSGVDRSLSLWLIDDEKDIYSALLPGIKGRSAIKSLRWFSNVADAVEEAQHAEIPDIILLDINLPGMNGIDAIPFILEACPTAKIIMLTVDRGMSNILRATTSGISGYILKPFRLEDILNACRSAMLGGISLDPEVTPQLIKELPRSHRSLKEYGLTIMEQKVVRLLVDGASNKEIAAQLLIGVDTVKVHCKHIFVKLDVDSRTQATAKVLKEHLL